MAISMDTGGFGEKFKSLVDILLIVLTVVTIQPPLAWIRGVTTSIA